MATSLGLGAPVTLGCGDEEPSGDEPEQEHEERDPSTRPSDEEFHATTEVVPSQFNREVAPLHPDVGPITEGTFEAPGDRGTVMPTALDSADAGGAPDAGREPEADASAAAKGDADAL